MHGQEERGTSVRPAPEHPSPMAVALAQGALIALVSYCLWRIVRPIFVTSPLAHIPGPPKDSLWKGECFLSRLFYRIRQTDFEKHRKFSTRYSAARVGISIVNWPRNTEMLSKCMVSSEWVQLLIYPYLFFRNLLLIFRTHFRQREELFVMDPLALHHVVVKDQYVYEETDSFIMCVPSLADSPGR